MDGGFTIDVYVMHLPLLDIGTYVRSMSCKYSDLIEGAFYEYTNVAQYSCMKRPNEASHAFMRVDATYGYSESRVCHKRRLLSATAARHR